MATPISRLSELKGCCNNDNKHQKFGKNANQPAHRHI